MANIILKNSRGRDGIYMYNSNGGLYISMVEGERIIKSEILTDGLRDDFDAIVEGSGKIDIVCQDEYNNIIHILGGIDSWDRRYVLQAKETSNTIASKFNIIKINAVMSVFYIIDNEGRKLLCHHIFSSNGIPEPLDYVDKTYSNYFALKDGHNNILLFYTNENSGRFGVRKYTWSKKEWGEFSEIGVRTSKVRDIYAFCGENGVLHLCLESSAGLTYQRHETDGRGWSREINITRQSIRQPIVPVITHDGVQLYITWAAGNRVFGTYSSDDGLHWVRAREIAGARGGDAIRFELRDFGGRRRSAYGFINNERINMPVAKNFFDDLKMPDSGRNIYNTGSSSEEITAITPRVRTPLGINEVDWEKIEEQKRKIKEQVELAEQAKQAKSIPNSVQVQQKSGTLPTSRTPEHNTIELAEQEDDVLNDIQIRQTLEKVVLAIDMLTEEIKSSPRKTPRIHRKKAGLVSLHKKRRKKNKF